MCRLPSYKLQPSEAITVTSVAVLLWVVKYVFLIAGFVTQLPTASPRKHAALARCVIRTTPLLHLSSPFKSLLSNLCSSQIHSGELCKGGKSAHGEPK